MVRHEVVTSPAQPVAGAHSTGAAFASSAPLRAAHGRPAPQPGARARHGTRRRRLEQLAEEALQLHLEGVRPARARQHDRSGRAEQQPVEGEPGQGGDDDRHHDDAENLHATRVRPGDDGHNRVITGPRTEDLRTVEPARRAISVAIVDDHVLVREGTAQLLREEPDLEVVGQASCASEGLALLRRVHADVALVDINLPDASGLSLARDVVRAGLATRVLIVSAYDDYAYVTEALEIGVGGYLLKTASVHELLEAVRAVGDGMVVLDRKVSARLARRRDDTRSDPAPPGGLTARESEVLALLGEGLANKQIAGELGLGLRTVEGYVSTVLAKLGLASRTEAALYAVANRVPERRDPA